MIKIIIDSLWVVAIGLLFISGIYYSFKLNFVHLNFVKIFKAIKNAKNNDSGINSFQALAMALGGKVGVGSLSGIALAVYLAGEGVLVWIWLTAILCTNNTFAESVLAVVYRKAEKDNLYYGGPFYYIKKGLKNKTLAMVYAIIVLVGYIGGFLTIQVNTLSKCVHDITGISPIIIGLAVVFLTAMTIIGGVKQIAQTTSKLVPIMMFFYLFVCLVIIVINVEMIPEVLKNIFNSAFNFKSFGTGIFTTLVIGMQKGIFSSEIGIGTGSIVAATANNDSAFDNALIQSLGIFIENIIIATLTVLVVGLSNYQNLVFLKPNGIEITLYAFKYHLGSLGPLFILISITLFALATILIGYYLAEASFKYIKKTNYLDILILKVITLIIIGVGSIVSSELIWKLLDIVVGLMAIINVYALLKLRKKVIKIYKENK